MKFKKWYNDLSVKTKVPMLVGVAGVVVFAAICILLTTLKLRPMALHNAQVVATLAADNSELKIGETINVLTALPRAFATIAANTIITNELDASQKRERLLNNFRNLANSDP